jgi:hypothetical protein
VSEQNGIEIDEESYKAGWRRELKEAIDAALEPYPVGSEREIEAIWVKKVRDNPLHDYKVVL